MKEKLISPEEVAAKLAVKPATVRAWLRQGKLKGFKAGQRVWRIREADFELFLEAGAASGESYPLSGLDRVCEDAVSYCLDEEKLLEDLHSLSTSGKEKVIQLVKELKARKSELNSCSEMRSYKQVRCLLRGCRGSLSDAVSAGRDERL